MYASVFKILVFINACDILEDLLDFQHSAFPLSPGPEVHLGQDARLPRTGPSPPSQESGIVLEKTLGI